MNLYLASNSPRRQLLLQQIGLTFQVVKTDIDETPLLNELPTDYVIRLAIAKAQSGYNHLDTTQQESACIIAADTTVSLYQTIYGKPQDKQQAVTMLMALSGKIHQVHTAIALYYQGQLYHEIVTTEVTMRSISELEAITYWQTGEPRDKAGGYAIQGLAAIFIERITGDYYAVVGLPLCATVSLLNQIGINPLSNFPTKGQL